MEHPETHDVTQENGIRPAGPPDRCFYCAEPLGSKHKSNCGCRRRTVKVRAILEYVVSVPEDYSVEQIEFHRNESSWCKGNMVQELKEIVDSGHCLCYLGEFQFVEEASKEDEDSQGFRMTT